MGLLIAGQWHDQWYDTSASGGRFVRQATAYRGRIAGEIGDPGFAPALDRYHLYVSLACPWAHRTLVMRNLKGLQSIIPVSVVNWLMLEHGWTFDPAPGVVADPVVGARYLHQLYTASNPTYTGRVTVPVLWDKATNTIVNNESGEILRIFNSAFDRVGATPGDYYPEAQRAEIDAVNARILDTLNNGVYKAGFGYTRDLYQTPGFAGTVNRQHIQGHYYQSHRSINPTGIVPAGPEIDFEAPHGREALC